MLKDHYKILGVQPTATGEEIKAAFKRLALEHHPDLHGGQQAKEALFKEINESYQVLSDPQQRLKYDWARALHLRAQQAHKATPPPYHEAPRTTPPPPRPAAPRWTPPPPSQPTAQTSSNDGATAAGIGGLFAAIGLGFIWAAAQGEGARPQSRGGRRGASGRSSRSYYDPSADRYRGPDGRFRRA